MSEVLFDIVFKGRFVNTLDKEKAVENFSKIFKLSTEKAEKFFDGNPRTLKKSQNMDKASHFRAALKKAGIRVSLIKLEDANPQKAELTLAEPGAVLVSKPFKQPKVFDVEQFSLAEVGVTMVKYQPVEKKHYNLNNLKVEEVGSIMAEKPIIQEPELDISNITMEEVGSTFSKKEIIQPPAFNIDDLNMQEVGATIVEKKKIPEPEINIDAIKLAD